MSEARLVQKIEKAIKAAYPSAWVVKLADRYHRGLPDLVVTFNVWHSDWPTATIWFETKTKNGRLSKIQIAEHEKIKRAGGLVFVAQSVSVVMTTLKEYGATV